MTSPAGPSGTTVTPSPGLNRVRLGRLEFTTGPRENALAMLQSRLDGPAELRTLVGFINPHVYNRATADAAATEFIETCDFVCVDGVGVRLASLLLDRTLLPRLVATELIEALLAGIGRPVDALLVGTTSAEVDVAATELNARFQRVRIIEAVDGFRDPDDYEELFRRHPQIDMVLVGAGTPRSEQILLRAREICCQAVAFHIGAGTIKLYAGTKRRAPRLLSRLGLEWVHRIAFEPHTRSRYWGGAWRFAADLIRAGRSR